MKRTGHSNRRTFATLIHVVALTVLFATFGQPGHPDKPSGVRRAVEAATGYSKKSVTTRSQIRFRQSPPLIA